MVSVIVGLVGAGGWLGWQYWGPEWVELKGVGGEAIVNNLEKYDFDSLKKAWDRGEYGRGEIEILGPIKEVEDRRKNDQEAKKYQFITRQIRFQSGGKWITGMMNYFDNGIKRPAVIMVRGYADKAGYYSGSGSWKMADWLAKEGVVTVSLDFLGYAQSDGESADMMEARFEKVPAVLDLLGAVKKLSGVDLNRIGFWAHSNGGQITLSVLEITGGNYPTVLWAPMTQRFPQSILETSADLEDGGRAVRTAVAKLAKFHDPRRYAFENYYQWINTPVVIFQGTKDPWCEVEWQREVAKGLLELGKSVELKVIEGAGHNMEGRGGETWKEVAGETVNWLKQNLN